MSTVSDAGYFFFDFSSSFLFWIHHISIVILQFFRDLLVYGVLSRVIFGVLAIITHIVKETMYVIVTLFIFAEVSLLRVR